MHRAGTSGGTKGHLSLLGDGDPEGLEDTGILGRSLIQGRYSQKRSSKNKTDLNLELKASEILVDGPRCCVKSKMTDSLPTTLKW